MTSIVKLDTPIKRGEHTLSEISITKPNAGALRGAAVSDLVRMDVNALLIVLPRVTEPPLTTADISAMDPADLLSLGTEVASFFLPRQVLKDIESPM